MMTRSFRMVSRPARQVPVSFVAPETVSAVPVFHRSLPCYRETPLYDLSGLAARIGAAKVLLKDESRRFGLNAFKGLGGSFAIGKILCDHFGIPLDGNAFRTLRSPEYASSLRAITFVTATDGNHGRGVAWAARLFGCKAAVYLPAGSAIERLENIRALGAHAEITSLDYDETVRMAAEIARTNGWITVQDTAWDGYTDIPKTIMQGYTTIGDEIDRQLTAMNAPIPTHLFLQAGVGSFAAALAGYFSALWGSLCPRIVIVEPETADCVFRTAEADDGRLHCVHGSMNSMMAGLCCGEVSPPAWELLKETASACIACGDAYSAEGMRMLAHPAAGDPAVVSGESGAVTAGVAAALMSDPGLSAFRTTLGLDVRSRILLISTEGDTDRANYLRILSDAAKIS